MKKFIAYLSFVFFALAFTACEDSVKDVIGTYSYKQSGIATIGSDQYKLPDEQGALTITRQSDSTVLLSFNPIAGSIYATTATFRRDSLFLNSFNRVMTVTSSITSIQNDYLVNVTGSAEKLEETILFHTNISGKSLDNSQTITGKNITLVAKRN